MRSKTLRIFTIFAATALILSGCVNYKKCQLRTHAATAKTKSMSGQKAAPAAVPANGVTSKCYKLAHFRSLVVGGPVIFIVKKGERQSVEAVGDNYALANLHPYVQNGILYIYSRGAYKYQKEPLTIKITTPSLYAMRVENCANMIMSSKLNIFDFAITDNKSCAMNLRGQIFAHKVKIAKSGSGFVNVKWLEANTIAIDAAKGAIKIAGRTQNLITNLTGNAYLDARYLRTKNANIEAKDSARVDVNVKQILMGNTFDKSNIFYYKTPSKLAVKTHDASNVLQLEAWK